jgi:hypothetical protein
VRAEAGGHDADAADDGRVCNSSVKFVG